MRRMPALVKGPRDQVKHLRAVGDTEEVRFFQRLKLASRYEFKGNLRLVK